MALRFLRIDRTIPLVLILLLCHVQTERAIAQNPIPPLADKHFCSWWQSRIRAAKPRKSVTPPSPAKALAKKMSPEEQQEIRSQMSQFATPLPSDPDNVRFLNEEQKTAAMGCLLDLEEDTHPAGFSGVTWAGVDQTFAQAPINLAALYYISYLYTGNWNHGNAIALRGPDVEDRRDPWNYATKQEAVHIAYKSYRRWYARVKEIGLDRAQAENLSPLEGTELTWY
jgi:hypothetical protein